MTTFRMQIFKDLAAFGNLEAVAKSHGIPERLVMEQIGLFQEECGTKLIEFRNGLATLTPEGKAREQIVSKILAVDNTMQ